MVVEKSPDEIREELKVQLRKAHEERQEIGSELSEVRERYSIAEGKANAIQLQIDALELAVKRKAELQNISRIGKDKVTVLDLIINGEGSVDDYRYYTKSGKEITIHIEYSAPTSVVKDMEYISMSGGFSQTANIGIKHYRDAQRLHKGGYRLQHNWGWHQDEISALMIGSRRRRHYKPEEIYAVRRGETDASR